MSSKAILKAKPVAEVGTTTPALSESDMHARIIELHASVTTLGMTEYDEESQESRELLARFRAEKKELAQLRNQLAIRFGEIYKLTRDPRELEDQQDPLRRLEHAELWRDAEGRAALIVHLFDYQPRLLDVDRDSLQSFATGQGWSVSFPDYVSWWHPGWTSLVVYVLPSERQPVNPSRRAIDSY